MPLIRMPRSLIAPLSPGAVDVVGDVHGEIEALEQLVENLGYDADGRHADGRRLVFVGDLVDRGPDSPAVVDCVMRLVSKGAQCIIGNHELNLLRGAEREGNTWFTRPEAATVDPTRRVDPARKRIILEFLDSLPLALEREDLRVVHACWHADALRRIVRDQGEHSGIAELHRHYEDLARAHCDASDLARRCGQEREACGYRMDDAAVPAPTFLPAHAEFDTVYQMGNPVRVVTSGPEAPAAKPFWAGGKWRMVQRVKWWETYDDATPVVIGHYWRRYSEAQTFVGDKDGSDVFAGIEPHHWMGKRHNVYCVDFSVGGRPVERRRGGTPPYLCKLAALRVPAYDALHSPDWEVVHDDGETWPIGAPGD